MSLGLAAGGRESTSLGAELVLGIFDGEVLLENNSSQTRVEDGVLVGWSLGLLLGSLDGLSDGSTDGLRLGLDEGRLLGI